MISLRILSMKMMTAWPMRNILARQFRKADGITLQEADGITLQEYAT
jgi:hypothetical protein